MKIKLLALSLAICLQAENLDEVLKDVVNTNPQILEKQRAFNASVWDNRDANSLFFPKVIFNAGTGYKKYKDEESKYEYEDDEFYEARLSLEQLIFDWGKTSALNKAKQQAAFSVFYDYLAVSNKVVFESIQAYIDVLKQEKLKNLASENVITHEKLLKNIKLSIERGKRGRSELERLQGRLAGARAKLLLKRNEYTQAVYNLHKILGRFIKTENMIMPNLDLEVLPNTLEEAFIIQAKNNALLREANYNMLQKQEELNSLEKDYFGKFSFEASGNFEREGDKNDEIEGRILLKYENTIFDYGRGSREEKIKSLIHKEQDKHSYIKRSLINDIQNSWNSYKLAKEQIYVLKQNLFYSNKALQTYKEEFIIGKRSLLNILDAQNECQHIKEQLASAEFLKEVQKYKILYTQGVLLEKLGLLKPIVKEILEKSQYLETLSKDTLPISDDFDEDKIINKYDISSNNKKNKEVNKLGISTEHYSDYFYKSLKDNKKKQVNILYKNDKISNKPMQIGVETLFDYQIFMDKSLELDNKMEILNMKDIILQSKAYSAQMPLYITVNTNEYKDEIENYNLALKRAYNLKKIFQNHKIEHNGIFVFVGKDKKRKNSMSFKFVHDSEDFEKQYSINFFKNRLFEQESTKIKNKEELNNLFKILENRKIKSEMILHCDDFKSKRKNETLCDKRAKFLEKIVKENKLEDKLSIISWGNYKKDPLDFSKDSATELISYVFRK